MRCLAVLVVLLIAPSLALAQDDDFQISGELKVKYFAVNDEPDILKLDYSDYNDSAEGGISFSAHLKIVNRLEIDGTPYLWYSRENSIARLGFFGTVKYEIWEDHLKIGYGHHSWHNADIDSTGRKQAQDWFFAEWNFWEVNIDESSKVNFYLEPRWYFNNGEFIQAKTIYDSDDPTAFAEASLRVAGNYHKLSWNLRPYAQFASDAYRYGVQGEISYSITNYLAFFIDANYYSTDVEDRMMIGIGIMFKFK